MRPSRHVHAVVSEHGAMLLDVRGRGHWTFLSSTAALLWSHLTAGVDTTEASVTVADRYRVDPALVESDTWALVEGLLARRLLVLDSGEDR
ncbi:PqqD family protein [Nocardiopsis halophila]|uniref:PqqD family protein n=1 Tax=Nocardiopsis halophila TaxID=141692 RepID=UPI0003768CC8|nr:PqqD family protein [Nocardiopsis halophila]